jgi:hypothetical protein
MRPDEREHIFDRRDTVASNLLIEELRFVFVNGGCRQRNVNAAVIERCEFNSQELNVSNDGRAATRGCAGLYVKHQFLRLAPPKPEHSGGGAQVGGL